MLAIGFPAALANLLSPLRLAVLSILVAWWFLEPGVAGVAVGYRIEFFTFLPALGYATAVLALVGQNLGAGKLERVGRSWRAAMVSAFAAGTLLGVAAALARGPAAALFSDDPVVTSYARSYLATIPLTFGAVSATVVAISALHALGRPWQGLAVAVARVALMAAAMLLAAGGLAGHPDPGALWVAIVAANVTTCIGRLPVAAPHLREVAAGHDDQDRGRSARCSVRLARSRLMEMTTERRAGVLSLVACRAESTATALPASRRRSRPPSKPKTAR